MTIKPHAVAALVLGLASAPAAHAEIAFQEDFEDGANPFAFDGYNDYFDGAAEAFSGERVYADPVRGHVWKTTFHDFRNDTYFGHRVRQKADWPVSKTLHWGAYVKFGDQSDSPEWRTADGYTSMGKRSYELKFPDIGSSEFRPGRIIGKFRSMRRGGYDGIFILYTPNGQNHSPQLDGHYPPFESGRWYAVEFGLEDRGADDRVRIWINNDEEDDPTYEYQGGDMFDFSKLREGTRYDHGYRNHNVPSDRVFYYDDVTIANSFIGLEPPRDLKAPRRPLRVRASD